MPTDTLTRWFKKMWPRRERIILRDVLITYIGDSDRPWLDVRMALFKMEDVRFDFSNAHPDFEFDLLEQLGINEMLGGV